MNSPSSMERNSGLAKCAVDRNEPKLIESKFNETELNEINNVPKFDPNSI